MTIVFIGQSALEFWQSSQVLKIQKLKNSGNYITLPQAYYDDFSIDPLDVIAVGRRFKLSFPVHLACPESHLKLNNRYFILHHCRKVFPEGSFQAMNYSGISCYIAKPELCFLQAAQILDKIDLALFGYDICAKYGINNDKEESIKSRDNLTSLKNIRDYIKNAKGFRGKRAARTALKHVADDSFSPQESRLSLMFSLPLDEGGYGIGKPHLNYPVKLDDLSKKALEQNVDDIHADLAWPRSRIIIEYNSNAFHLKKDAYTNDAMRQTIYKRAKYHSHVMTTGHLKDIDALDNFVMLVWSNVTAEGLEKYRSKRKELFTRLFHSWLTDDDNADVGDADAQDNNNADTTDTANADTATAVHSSSRT